MSVRVEKNGPVTTVVLHRPERRNAVDRPTAEALAEAFREFDADESAAVAVLYGDGGTFCAGADLQAMGSDTMNRLDAPSGFEVDGPMGPSRMQLSKPVIAAVEGFAVAGGLELAVWCDLRVVASDATFGVYCRRWGVPLIDGGTVRLPRIVGHGVALDLILTGRSVDAEEALRIGLASRVVAPGTARAEAEALALQLSELPQVCMRRDRLSALEQWGLDETGAIANEWEHGLVSLTVAAEGVAKFQGGAGRHGA
ncbi:MAG TPA: crotonase/enoyl-CoA hydratase family protein [Nocardioidaceae bacterium]|nr:crotonase/enoyl-CoA hydratase family protein [Nocardioidaceae bacterium]